MAYLVHMEVGDLQTVVPAKRSDDRSLPLVVCFSDGYQVIRNTGSYTVKMGLEIRSQGSVEVEQEASDPSADSDDLVGSVIDALWTIEDGTAWDSKKLAAQITVAARVLAATDPKNADLADFTAFDVRHVGGEQGFTEQGSVWSETVQLEIDCAPSAVD